MDEHQVRGLLRCEICTRLTAALDQKLRIRTAQRPCVMGPQYPSKRTLRGAVGRSPQCHEPTYAVQQEYRYSITSSAMASSVGGITMPSSLAVCWLMTNSNLDACMTGNSAGFSPLRIRAT
jgi:hypothetical protein